MRIVVPCSFPQLQEVLDPWTYRRKRCIERWQQCRAAAVAALKACADLPVRSACELRRRDLDLDGEIPSFFHPTRKQWMPLLPAARSVLGLYLEAMPYKTSELVFVDDDGGSMLPSRMQRLMRELGSSIGIYDLQASLTATFFYAVQRSDADEHVKSALLQDQRREAQDWPDLPLLLSALSEHPLAPYGRLSFYDRKTPADPFFREIFFLANRRELSKEERRILRNRRFPDALALYKEGLLTRTQIGRYFGVDKWRVIAWSRLYLKSGYLPPVDGDMTQMSQRWKALAMAEYERLFTEDDPNFAELHGHLVANFDFPFSRHALDDLFIRTGQHVPSAHPKAVGKTGVRMTAEWRRLVDLEYEEVRGKPGNWSGFLRLLQDKHQFPFTERTLVKYLKNKGGQAFEDEHQYWMKVIVETAKEKRPTKLKPFYRELVERHGCPLAPATVWEYLQKKAGISMTQNAREQREKFTAIIVREARKRRPTSRTVFHRQMVEEFGFPYGDASMCNFLKRSGISIADFRTAT